MNNKEYLVTLTVETDFSDKGDCRRVYKRVESVKPDLLWAVLNVLHQDADRAVERDAKNDSSAS